MKSLAIIGSTGSIGKSALNIYKKNRNQFNLVLLAANQNYKKLIKQNSIYRPKHLILFDKKKKNFIKKNKFFIDPELFLKNTKKIDYVISGVSGYDAIKLNLLDRENVLEINKILPTISVLVNNAGITQDNLFIRMQEQEIDDVMSVNLTNTLLLTKQCIRGMLRAKFGRIINITSIVGHSGNIGQANYAASKAGMTAFTKSIALEYGSKNITANCIAPGFIETDMSLDIAADKREKILHSIPLGRFGAPEDVANAVKFLSSEAANYITGSTIHVNGGMSML